MVLSSVYKFCEAGTNNNVTYVDIPTFAWETYPGTLISLLRT